MILVKSVFNEDQNNYYHNVFFFNILRNNMNIQYYDRTKFSERIDVNKTKASKECHKFQINFNIFHLYIFNECHDLVVMCISLNFTILNI